MLRKRDIRVIDKAKKYVRQDLTLQQWTARGYAWDTNVLSDQLIPPWEFKREISGYESIGDGINHETIADARPDKHRGHCVERKRKATCDAKDACNEIQEDEMVLSLSISSPSKTEHGAHELAIGGNTQDIVGPDTHSNGAHHSPHRSSPAFYLTIQYENHADLSVERFQEMYERPCIPVVIRGALDDWPAYGKNRWSMSNLDRRLRHIKVRVGDDDDGDSVRMKMKYFTRYTETQRDDSPLYVFDSKPLSDSSIRGDYKIPKYFEEDLLDLLPNARRPPNKWLLIGPKRSGSGVHIDPLGTSAWNALVSGRKRWIFFPPGTLRRFAKAKRWFRENEDDEPIDYFSLALPRMKKEVDYSNLNYIEFIQEPGDLLYVPGGWWHGVLNIEDTVAVTHNFCSTHNFATVWRDTRVHRRGMARLWLVLLSSKRPDLVQLVADLNTQDQFDMDNVRETHHVQFLDQLKKRRQRRMERRENRKRIRLLRKEGEESEKTNSSSSSEESSETVSSLSHSAGYGYSDDDLETVLPARRISRNAIVDEQDPPPSDD